MPNPINRIYYASQAVNLKPQDSTGANIYGVSWLSPKGVQSVGITTNFNIEQVFQLGQLDLYDQVEETPDVQVTMSKIIDGTPPLYFMCMGGSTGITGANGKDLAALSTNRVNFRLGIFSDANSNATGLPSHYVTCSGMYLSSFNFTFPVDGNATEEITLVGNNKVWGSGSATSAGTTLVAPTSAVDGFGFTGSGLSPSTIRRYNINYGSTVLPTGTGGIRVPQDRTNGRPYVQNITISADLGREAISEFGSFAPYFRYVNFPVEITSEFTVIGSDGDYVEANDFASTSATCGQSYKNLTEKPIKIVVCGSGATDTLTLDLGSKNKLTSVNYTGGDTGGGNVNITYSFRTFNTFIPSATGSFIDVKYIDNTDNNNFID
jgi:hypothetical protein